ncbi:MAG: hypothetical protein H5U03_07510 [Clostridia bacterium]|nr:hypothetical protein [Clostridia bacterium]
MIRVKKSSLIIIIVLWLALGVLASAVNSHHAGPGGPSGHTSASEITTHH